MTKQIHIHFLAALVLSLMAALVIPSFAAESRQDKVGFWEWSAVQDMHGGGFNSSITGHSFGEVCSSSPDKLHHSDEMGHFGGYDDNGRYTVCTCKHCGETYKVYASDLQQSYSAQVSALPAPSYDSDGKLRFPLPVVNFSPGSYATILYSQVGSPFTLAWKGDPGLSWTTVNVEFNFKAPVAGNYQLSYTISATSADYSIYSQRFGIDLTPLGPNPDYFVSPQVESYAAGSYIFDPQNSEHLKEICFMTEKGTPSGQITGHFEFLCTPATAPSGDTYNVTSRPGVMLGMYGDVNGNAFSNNNLSIVNETNNTYTNPATGTTDTITDWSYNYEDRSYTLTLGGGTTSTVTYGDENVTIKEGDTTYNVYYLVDGAEPDTPTPGPDTPIPGTCNHSWTETSTTPATCTVPGSRLLTCSLCNQTKTEATPAPGHTWVIRQTVNTQYDETGNKTQEGYTIFECSVCGEQYKTTDGGTPPGGNTGAGSGIGNVGGVFSGIFGLLVDFLSFFWNTFRDFVGEGVKGFLTALMDGTSSIFGLLNPFNWGG